MIKQHFVKLESFSNTAHMLNLKLGTPHIVSVYQAWWSDGLLAYDLTPMHGASSEQVHTYITAYD